jgi:hypothetical protein
MPAAVAAISTASAAALAVLEEMAAAPAKAGETPALQRGPSRSRRVEALDRKRKARGGENRRRQRRWRPLRLLLLL